MRKYLTTNPTLTLEFTSLHHFLLGLHCQRSFALILSIKINYRSQYEVTCMPSRWFFAGFLHANITVKPQARGFKPLDASCNISISLTSFPKNISYQRHSPMFPIRFTKHPRPRKAHQIGEIGPQAGSCNFPNPIFRGRVLGRIHGDSTKERLANTPAKGSHVLAFLKGGWWEMCG